MEHQAIAELTSTTGAIAHQILSGDGLDHRSLLDAAVSALEADPKFDIRLLQQLKEQSADNEAAFRVLRILSQVSDAQRLVAPLMRFMGSDSGQVRALAARLIAKGIRKPEWIAAHLKDPDPRVRANLIEGAWLWLEDQRVLLYAANDSHHRVACNALLRLRQLKAPSAASRLQRLAQHSDPMFRRAAAWAMGATREPWFYPVLNRMRSDSDPAVRLKALQGMRSIYENCAPDPDQLKRLREAREELPLESDDVLAPAEGA